MFENQRKKNSPARNGNQRFASFSSSMLSVVIVLRVRS